MKNNLKTIRLEKGFTQVQVANKAHLSERGYQYIETGKRSPNVYLALEIAKALNVTVEELFPQQSE
ncbi:MAG: helix-turn-helix domain-containing protein [Lachnospiraceae bacterium]